jgi:TorA maturation chaperone TorD
MMATELRSGEPAPARRLEGAVSPEDELRAGVYALLGALLGRAPDRQLLEHLATFELVDAGAGPLARAWSSLRSAALEADVAQVAREYHDLFIGLGRGELVPYGSHYLTGFLMERPLAQLRDDLAALGYARQEGVSEPEDHAAALCEVMSQLVAGHDARDLDPQRAFFEAHLGPWLGRFFDDLEQAGAARFYAAVGALGARFVEMEQDAFAMTT